MKILLINKFYYLKGGSEKHFFELKNTLEEKGHEVFVLTTENKKNIKSGENEYFISEVAMNLKNFFNGYKLFYNPEAIKKLEEIIINHKIDVVHLHNISHHFSPAIIKVLKKNNIPTVMTIHDYKLICPNYKLFNRGEVCEKCQGGKFYQCTLNKCTKDSYLGSLVMTLEAYWAKWKNYYEGVDIFLAPSRFMANKLIQNNIDITKIKYLPNFLDESEMKKDFDPKDNLEKEKYILSFGRLSAEKGLGVLIRAMSEIKNSEVTLRIAGEGDELENIKKLSESLGLKNRIKFLGYKSKEEIKKLIENSSFVIVPSIWYENAPYSILEAFLNNKAVIGSLAGGIGELVIDGKSGLTFEIGNHQELAKRIDELLENPDSARKMGENGRKLVENELNKDKYYKRIMSVYESLKK